MTWLGPVAILPLVALAACASSNSDIVEARAYDVAAQRAFLEAPFAAGTLVVEAVEDGRLRSWDLVPCRDGRAVCAGDAGGPAGQVQATRGYVVVSGLHHSRFWLSWGGDGYVERNGRFAPLTWDARVNGQGPGFDPYLESAVPHS